LLLLKSIAIHAISLVFMTIADKGGIA